MSEDRYNSDVWFKAFRHEASHAVAALSRERPVKEILINNPLDGFTRHGSDDTPDGGDDRQFIAYAGSWAEARTANEIAGIEDGPPSIEDVRALLRKNSFDWAEYHTAIWGRDVTSDEREAAQQAYSAKTVPPNECPPDPEWEDLLDALWGDVKSLAKMFQTGREVVELGYGQLPLHQVKQRRTHWQREGWTSPDADEWVDYYS
jgi:hypothetical protein